MSLRATRHWHALDDGRVQCDICPRLCRLGDGQRGFCFVRQNVGGEVVLTTYGRSSGFCIDPIEKKPLHHFFPGSAVLSFGTAGCNLACRFCQNWSISKSREVATLADEAPPERIARAAAELGCSSVAFTYNDPVVFHEYAVDTAAACRARGIKTVAVTAGQVLAAPRAEFYAAMDAANVDLKSFDRAFYRSLCSADLDAVLDTLRYVARETQVWLELTTLLIPGRNDSAREIDAMTRWVVEQLGADVPMHFTAFHPDWKMRDVPPTPARTLDAACAIARKNGVRYTYTGNVRDARGSTTFCSSCGAALIERDGYHVAAYRLDAAGACGDCGTPLPGVFAAGPGTGPAHPLAVDIESFA